MLFYVALAVACVVVAALGVWVLRSVLDIGNSTHRAILPSRHTRRHQRFNHLNSNVTKTPSPWGWAGADGSRHAVLHRQSKSHATPARNGPKEKAPWGWPGNEGLHRSNLELIADGIENSAAVGSVRDMFHRPEPQVGWPYREEARMESSERRKSRGRGRATRGSDRKPAKPWGW